MSVSLSAVCLSVCLFVCMCLSVCLYVCLPICLPICQSVCLSAVCLYVCLSVCPTVRMSDFLTVRTSHFVPVNLSGDRSQRFPKQYARMLSLWSDKKFWNVIGRHLLLGLTFGAIYQTCVLPHLLLGLTIGAIYQTCVYHISKQREENATRNGVFLRNFSRGVCKYGQTRSWVFDNYLLHQN